MTQSAKDEAITAFSREISLILNYLVAGNGIDEIDRLLDCCLHFRNGRLGDVLTRDEVLRRAAFQRAGRSYQEILSQEIASMSGLTIKFQRWCVQHGVKYVGELTRVRWGRGSTTVDVAIVTRQLLAQEGVPLDFNLDAAGWVPPYALDPATQGTWAMTRSRFGEAAELTRGWGIYKVPDSAHFMYQLFCDSEVSPRFLEQRYKLLSQYDGHSLHAGMWVPGSLAAKLSVSAIDPEWANFLATTRK